MDPADITLASTDAAVIQIAAASSSTYAMARVPVTGARPGRAVEVDPMNPMLKAPGT